MRFMLRSRSLLFALFMMVMSVTSFAQVHYHLVRSSRSTGL